MMTQEMVIVNELRFMKNMEDGIQEINLMVI